MKTLIAFMAAAAICPMIFSAPVVSDVSMVQSPGRTVTITYTLAGEPGIVTVDVRTNAGENAWVSIGDRYLTYFAGDVNRKVETGSRTITWKPHKAWPDNKVTENVKVVLSAWATNAPPDYMVMSLVSPKSVEYYTSSEAIPYGVSNDLYKTDYLVMRKIPAANVRWRMGSPAIPEEVGRNATREAPHEVTLSDDYYIGIYPVTQRQYERFVVSQQPAIYSRPSHFCLESDYMTRPVENVSTEDLRGEEQWNWSWPKRGHEVSSTRFLYKLRSFTGVDNLDLPTEAQWEFACRAGCGSALYNGQELEDATTSARVGQLARYAHNGGKPNGSDPAADCTAKNGTAKVGSYEPNAWGLYDMYGNVFELCLDWYIDAPSGAEAETGPSSSPSNARVLRGGAWNMNASACRSAYRTYSNCDTRANNIGFRLCCVIGPR